MKPDAMLPDDIDTVEAAGITVRKGSVGAFLASWRAWRDPALPPGERDIARADLLALVPALDALGLFEVFEARDPELRSWIEQCRLAAPDRGR